MKTNWTIPSTLVTLSLGAFMSACSSADLAPASDLPGLESSDSVEVVDSSDALTSCDDSQYDHWRHLSALAIAAGNELGRWNATKDFVNNGGVIGLSSEGSARCKNGCQNILAVLSLQTMGAGVIPRHDPNLLKSKLQAFFLRQQSWDSNNGGAIAHTLTPTTITTASCGYRYWFKDTVNKLSGSTALKSILSNKCVDGTGLNDGAGLMQASCDGTSDQNIVVEPIASGGYRLKSTSANKCFRVKDTSAGSQLELRTCDNSSNQLFEITDYGLNNGKYAIKSLYSKNCAEIANWSTSDGARLQQGGCSQYLNNQLFSLSLSTVEMSLPDQAKMYQMLNFVGGSENPYIQFQYNSTEVSIDPMGTMVDGGYSGQSGSCHETSTVFDSTRTCGGSCCSVGRSYGKLTQSSWNDKIYYCKF